MRINSNTLEYLNGKKELTPLEYEIMKFIWQQSEEVQSSKIYESFPQSRNTLASTIHKLTRKGYLESKQVGVHHVYNALVSANEYERAVLRQQIKKATGSSTFEHLVAAFYGKDKLNKKQQEKVNSLIKEFENSINDE